MPGREGDDLVALVDEGLELRGEVDRARTLRGPALVEGGDADGVASGDDARGRDGLVEEDEGEHAVELRTEGFVLFTVLCTKGEEI